ncbi:hypothetical protein QJS66_19520 [Kocuria rhizophila]|nr:hypothetical protein QJS66_19520 [Kocuria rhizophila]
MPLIGADPRRPPNHGLTHHFQEDDDDDGDGPDPRTGPVSDRPGGRLRVRTWIHRARAGSTGFRA